MNTGDIPAIYTAQTTTNNYRGDVWAANNPIGSALIAGKPWEEKPDLEKQFADLARTKQHPQKIMTEVNYMAIPLSKRRIVQVFIVDPDDKVPLEEAMLFESEPKLTDLTDQELFFEVSIKNILDAHNEVRKVTLDKKATAQTGKDVFLEPVKIRDLAMTVVEIATF